MKLKNRWSTVRGLRFASMILASTTLLSQDMRTRQVLTLQVVELNKIDININALTFMIAGENILEPAAVNAMTKLVWTSNGENRKITIASKNASPRYRLKARALDFSDGSGSSAGEIKLSDNATHDFVLGISRSSGNCAVRFTATASVREATRTQKLLVMYTITSS